MSTTTAVSAERTSGGWGLHWLRAWACAVLMAVMPQTSFANATFSGTWGAGGHWVGSPIAYQFVDSPGGGNPHPARNWTDNEKGVLREAFAEWDRVLCNICFTEVTTDANITLRWEDGDLFGMFGVPAGAAALAYPPTVDLGLPAAFPKNEIYFNTTAMWYVDADPTTDEAIPAGQWDLLSVAKHEIGHMLGLMHQEQDFFDNHPNHEPGVMDDRSVANGGWGAGMRRHDNTADYQALKDLGYAIHLPEPSAVALVLLGLALLRVSAGRKAAVRV